MFVQFIEGSVGDPEELRRQMDRWLSDHADAVGWLGATAGVTPDGTGFIAARFSSAEDAQRNADRPEQGQWWERTAQCFSGPVEFTDCTEVETMLGGGSDDARFVQVIHGRMTDRARAMELFDGVGDQLASLRPDILGGYFALHGDDGYTQVVYFTSEEDARAGEAQEATDEAAGLDDEYARLQAEPPRYLDLPDPWLASA